MENIPVEETNVPVTVPDVFHIYVLSLLYGSLVVMVVGHLMWRWHWRRTGLTNLQSCRPGDKSFRCKAMKKQINHDFNGIQRLQKAPNAKLINKKYEPNQFGLLIDNASYPSHWYRMRAFDAVANFVCESARYAQNIPEAAVLTLPLLLSLLTQEGLLTTKSEIIFRSCELYKLARYGDGNFTESQLTELLSMLAQLQVQLAEKHQRGVCPSEQPSLLTSSGSFGYKKHGRLKQTTSNELLLGGHKKSHSKKNEHIETTARRHSFEINENESLRETSQVKIDSDSASFSMSHALELEYHETTV